MNGPAEPKKDTQRASSDEGPDQTGSEHVDEEREHPAPEVPVTPEDGPDQIGGESEE